MFNFFRTKKTSPESPPEDAPPIPSSNADNIDDFTFVDRKVGDVNPPAPSSGSLYPAFNGMGGLVKQQSVDKYPSQSLQGVPFKLSSQIAQKESTTNNQRFQIHEIMARLQHNLESPAYFNYEFKVEKNVIQSA